jgi:hypothetical protein
LLFLSPRRGLLAMRDTTIRILDAVFSPLHASHAEGRKAWGTGGLEAAFAMGQILMLGPECLITPSVLIEAREYTLGVERG